VGHQENELKQRLDVLLVQRGLASSRERASALVLSGVVMVNGQPAQKAGMSVPDDAAITLKEPDHPYVGRGGIKLAHALDIFRIDVAGREALDIGASTGGFTDVLLKRGATRVVAFDVGHGQLDWSLRNDSRVVAIERANARTLEPSHLPALVDIVTIDVSFISLRHIFPRVPALVRNGADVVALVKPQFEAGRTEVGKKGVVRDPAVHARVVEEASRAAAEVGLLRQSMIESPITGDTGNREFFLHLRLHTREPQPE
jgi:23S rRNA (cytidine1920-2'-O)/16S rRNA (cytidine1409-2'-O)-methyltransferase